MATGLLYATELTARNTTIISLVHEWPNDLCIHCSIESYELKVLTKCSIDNHRMIIEIVHEKKSFNPSKNTQKKNNN